MFTIKQILQCPKWKIKSCCSLYKQRLQASHSQKKCFIHSSRDIRDAFIKFYKDTHQHTFVPSSKVFSPKDDTLLFVNAGMNQFKPLLLGNVDSKRFDNVTRAVNSQKCIRAGGKHNDLEDVGFDLCHHTLFEMLGSWSFGDYFKKEACQMAWSFLTEILKLPTDRLYITYFDGCKQTGLEADFETKEIWQSIGVHPSRILPFGLDCNFWEMGETGPCGPCTEIHYDQTGNRFAPKEVNVSGSDIVEIWNLVFMQYNRVGANCLQKLEKFHVDTGMGLERITAIMQGKVSNYDTDLFLPIISALEKHSSCRSYSGMTGKLDADGVDASYRIVSDHIRMLTIAIADGVIPGPRGRDLVVRHVLRRAVECGIEVLKLPRMFLGQLVPIVIKSLSSAFPELIEKENYVIELINDAEKVYHDMIDNGDHIFDKTLLRLKPDDRNFPVDIGIKLLSYLGYPMDRFKAKLQTCGKIIDLDQINKFFDEKHSVTHKKSNKNNELNLSTIAENLAKINVNKTEFVNENYVTHSFDGRINFSSIDVDIKAFVSNNGDVEQDINKMNVYEKNGFYIVLDKSCFYHSHCQRLRNVGNVLLQQNVFSVDRVINVQGWLLHHIYYTKKFSGEVNNGVQLWPTKDSWLPLLRAFKMALLFEKTLQNLSTDSKIQEVKFDHDKVKYNLSGIMSSDDVLALEQLLQSRISQSESQLSFNEFNMKDDVAEFSQEHLLRLKDIGAIVITKHKLQGSARTILQIATGDLAIESLNVLNQLKTQVESAKVRYNELQLQPNLEESTQLLQILGPLLYTVNKSDIQFNSKFNYRQTLEFLSSRLRTMQRRIKRSQNTSVVN